jgi:hypothetical protein
MVNSEWYLVLYLVVGFLGILGWFLVFFVEILAFFCRKSLDFKILTELASLVLLRCKALKAIKLYRPACLRPQLHYDAIYFKLTKFLICVRNQ